MCGRAASSVGRAVEPVERNTQTRGALQFLAPNEGPFCKLCIGIGKFVIYNWAVCNYFKTVCCQPITNVFEIEFERNFEINLKLDWAKCGVLSLPG